MRAVTAGVASTTWCLTLGDRTIARGTAVRFGGLITVDLGVVSAARASRCRLRIGRAFYRLEFGQAR